MQKKCRSRHLLQALSRLRGKKSNRIPGRETGDIKEQFYRSMVREYNEPWIFFMAKENE